ncbi:MAG: hypothetical protein FJ381_00850 [Verrucomicrobia bacterium]|nr:hypothetical protein [Verrucomicrobiota bacterium]
MSAKIPAGPAPSRLRPWPPLNGRPVMCPPSRARSAPAAGAGVPPSRWRPQSSARRPPLAGPHRSRWTSTATSAPLLSNTCLRCHGPDTKGNPSGLRLDRPEFALAPHQGESGRRITAWVPGKPAAPG